MINYAVYCDGKPLYIYGDSLRALLTPTLTLEVNKAGSLEFSVLPGHPLFNQIHKMRSFIQVFRNGKEIWAGRPLNDGGDFYCKRKFYCEGQLAFLNDSKRAPNTFSGTVEQYISRLLANHNAQMYTESNKIFQPGAVEISGMVAYTQSEPQSTWKLLKTQLLDVFGGYLRLRKENGIIYLDYLKESGKHSRQIIEFGKNLLDLSDYTDADGIYSVLIPYGAKNEAGEYIGIESVNNGVNYIKNDAAVAEYTRIVDVVMFNEITNPAELLEAAKSELQKRLLLASTVTVSAIDLVRTGINTDILECGDYIPMLSKSHDLNTEFICSKVVERVDVPNQTKYTLGASLVSLTAKQVAAGQRVAAVNDAAASAASTAVQAQQSVNALSQTVGGLAKTISGNVSVTIPAAGEVSTTVAFSSAFTAAPEVLLMPQKSGVSYQIIDITAVGFTFTASGAVGDSAVFSWIATK